MDGFITKRAVLSHCWYISRHFGVRVFLQCLMARHSTFLEILNRCHRI